MLNHCKHGNYHSQVIRDENKLFIDHKFIDHKLEFLLVYEIVLSESLLLKLKSAYFYLLKSNLLPYKLNFLIAS